MEPTSLLLCTRVLAHGSITTSISNTTDDLESIVIPYQNHRVAVIQWSRSYPQLYFGIADLPSENKQQTLSIRLEPLLSKEEIDQEQETKTKSDWGLAWSPDGQFLIIYRHVQDAAMWIYTRSEWMQDLSSTQPLLVRVNPSHDASWNKPSMIISAILFPSVATPRVCLLVTACGSLIKMEIHTSGLLRFAHVADETISLFSMETIVSTTNWHACITATAYDVVTKTLVLTGGIDRPSPELYEQDASSLSVWSITDSCTMELLDYTMILSDRQVERSEEPSNGLVSNVFGLLTGQGMRNSVRRLEGRIRQVAISTDGRYLSLVDCDGRYRIRQIEACADVLTWESIHHHQIKAVLWLSPAILAFTLTNGQVVYTKLEEGEEEDKAMTRVLTVEQDMPCMDQSMSLARVETSSNSFQVLEWTRSGSLVSYQSVCARDFMHALLASQQYERALALAQAADVSESDIHRQIWEESLEKHGSKTGSLVLIDSPLLSHLEAVYSTASSLTLQTCQDYVIQQCLATVPCSLRDMKALFQLGLSINSKCKQLKQYLDRLDLFIELLSVEEEDIEEEELYDAPAFVLFRDASLLAIAQQLASDARIKTLQVVWQRYQSELEHYRFQLIEMLPLSISPSEFTFLLEDSDQAIEWYQMHVKRLDAWYGQVEYAYQLSLYTPLEEVHLSLQRLIHYLGHAKDRTLSLETWSLLSPEQQVWKITLDLVDSSSLPHDQLVTKVLDVLRHIMLSTRPSTVFVWDRVWSWWCQALKEINLDLSLALSAHLLNQSNPSHPLSYRWIQQDLTLLQTSVDILVSTSFSNQPLETIASRHSILSEYLWMIFQSLPVRKEHDPIEMTQVQVQVDGIEDLLIAMDILAKYEIWTCPHHLRSHQTSQWISQMVEYAVVVRNQPWTIVWEDVDKLKIHLFGSQITSEHLLQAFLSPLLVHSHLLMLAEQIFRHWYERTSGVDMEMMLDWFWDTIQVSLDQGDENTQYQYLALGSQLVSLCQGSTCVLDRETRVVQIQTLVRLWTNDLVPISLSTLRPLLIKSSPSEREAIIRQVYSCDPEHYRIPYQLKTWLKTQGQSCQDDVLDGLLYLSSLLSIPNEEQPGLFLQVAYAAMTCRDYTTAQRILEKVLREFSTSLTSERWTLMVSLVVDLFSVSSFSWTNKLSLGSLLVTRHAQSVVSSDETLWDLVYQQLKRLDAIQSLATALDMTESSLEGRQQEEQTSLEHVLLSELERVIDVIDDPCLILSLLQKGFALVDQKQTPTWMERLTILAFQLEPEYGFAYLFRLEQSQLERIWKDTLQPLCLQDKHLLEQVHHYILYLTCQCPSVEISQSLLYSYRATREWNQHETSPIYVSILQECQTMLQTHQQSQQLAAFSSKAPIDINVERFAIDPVYQTSILEELAIHPLHYSLAVQWADQYQIDPYRTCLLPYIRHSFLQSSDAGVEQAFRNDEMDFLEAALERPHVFAPFLMTDIYEQLAGTDYISILLVFRMLLECSKRSIPEPQCSFLPLSQASQDRIRLLFMCLKRIKDVSGSDRMDFKQVCGVSTSRELLVGPSIEEEEAVAHRSIQAIVPFLTSGNLKMLTKILQNVLYLSQKELRIQPSSMVLIYLNHTLRHEEKRGMEAYQACLPYLSILSPSHLLWFYHGFLQGTKQPILYGQVLNGLTRFHPGLSLDERLLICEQAWQGYHKRGLQDETLFKSLQAQWIQAMVLYVLYEILPSHVDVEDWKNDLYESFCMSDTIRFEEKVWSRCLEWWELVQDSQLFTLVLEMILIGANKDEKSIEGMMDKVLDQRALHVLDHVIESERGDSVRQRVYEWSTQWKRIERAPTSAVQQLQTYVSALKQPDSSRYDEILIKLSLFSSPLSAMIERRRNNERASNLLEMVLIQWKNVLKTYEEKKEWGLVAVICEWLLFVVPEASTWKEWYFGLRVQAVSDHLDKNSDLIQRSSEEIYPHFINDIFTHLQARIHQPEWTIAVASMIEEYYRFHSMPTPTRTWSNEKNRAIMERLEMDFQSKVTPKEEQVDISLDTSLWSILLLHGVWGDEESGPLLMIQWYTTTYAYSIESNHLVTYVNNSDPSFQTEWTSLLLLLHCPFPSLRIHEENRIIKSTIKVLQSSFSTHSKHFLLQRLVLQWNLPKILSIQGMESQLVGFYMNNPQSSEWTSSIEYYICRLVTLGHWAAAARLVCAFSRVSVHLWNVENSRMMLTKYLERIAHAPIPTQPNPFMTILHQVRVQTYTYFQQQ